MALENTPLDRAFAVLDALERPGPSSRSISQSLEALSGFELTGAHDDVRQSIELLGRKYNSLVRRYPTTSPETPPNWSDEDACILVMHLRQLAELIRDVETERILNRLRDHRRVLPEAEIIEARRHRDWFIPHFIRECHEQIAKLKALENPNDLLPDDQQSTIPFFSIFLFSEWHVIDATPVILESLSLPGEGPFELFGDGVHEQAARYLAQFLSDDLDQIDALVRDANANRYVRWCAASSYKFLVRDLKISVRDAVARLDRLFQETKTVADDGSPGVEHCVELSAGIVDVIDNIGGAPESAIPDDIQSWTFIDEAIIDRERFNVRRSPDDEGVSRDLLCLPPTRIEDCLEELRWWATFNPRPKPAKPSPTFRRRQRPATAVSPPSAPDVSPAAKKPLQGAGRVPRNAPCPCGSGRKYKQCCLRKETSVLNVLE